MNLGTYTQNVKEETSSEGDTSHMESDTDVVRLKTERGPGGEAEREILQLYAEHEIKEEMVIGPVVLQRAAHSYSTDPSEDAPLLKTTRLETEDDKTDQVEPQKEIKGNYCEEVITNVELTHDMKTREVKNREPNKNCKQRKHTQTDKIIFICNDCGKYCDNKCALALHIKTHKQIKQDNNMTRRLRIHTGEKPYSCSYCEYKCTRKSELTIHLRTHTGGKPYSCFFCDYKCTVKSSLIGHIRTHTGEKPFTCSLCEYKCRGKSRLAEHLRSHTGEKPYSCSFCEYKANGKTNLTVHLRCHTGEKPYTCSFCEYKFTQKHCLIRHLRIHNGENSIPVLCVTSNNNVL